MATPVALKGHFHTCPLFTGNTPHIGGAISEGANELTVNGIPIALVGHHCQCQAGGADTLTQGHPSLRVNGVQVVLQGGGTAHGGVVVEGDGALTVE